MEHQEIKGENMTEQRLIDANMMAVEESEAYVHRYGAGKRRDEHKNSKKTIHRHAQEADGSLVRAVKRFQLQKCQ